MQIVSIKWPDYKFKLSWCCYLDYFGMYKKKQPFKNLIGATIRKAS